MPSAREIFHELVHKSNRRHEFEESCSGSPWLVKYKTLGYFATTGLKRTFRYRKWLSRSAILETRTSTKFTASFFCLPVTGNSTRPPRLDQKPCETRETRIYIYIYLRFSQRCNFFPGKTPSSFLRFPFFSPEPVFKNRKGPGGHVDRKNGGSKWRSARYGIRKYEGRGKNVTELIKRWAFKGTRELFGDRRVKSPRCAVQEYFVADETSACTSELKGRSWYLKWL